MLSDLTGIIERDLSDRLDRLELPRNMLEAVRYAVLGAGKRLRPILTLLSCEAVGGDQSSALPAASALELIHCFSLVHDDLPAMDDDDLRRGRATLHIHAGEAMAILAGDVMHSLAFEIINKTDMSDEIRTILTSELARATTSMIAGQVYDTLGGFPEQCSEAEKLLLIHHNKTGALIRCACRFGAYCGGASESQITALDDYGQAIGFMFQIVDDLLDVTQSAEHIGKVTGKDTAKGKITYPDLTNLFTEFNTEVTVDTDNVNFYPIGLILNDIGNDGRNNSWAVVVPADSIYGSNV